MPETIKLTVNGVMVNVQAGCMVSAAILMAGESVLRRSVTGEPRGPLCGMGICFECRVTINAELHQQSCQTFCANGMKVCTGK